MTYQLEGFVIIPPVNSWDNKACVISDMCYSSLGRTAAEAWTRHMRVLQSDLDWSKKVQHWHDRGYRLKKATLTIEE
jgi:hypothetical protein